MLDSNPAMTPSTLLLSVDALCPDERLAAAADGDVAAAATVLEAPKSSAKVPSISALSSGSDSKSASSSSSQNLHAVESALLRKVHCCMHRNGYGKMR